MDENEDIATELIAEQDFNLAAQQFDKAIEESRQYNRPSFLKYGFLFAVAGVMDIVDIADITGVGIIISKIVSIGGTTLIYLVLWLTNGKMRRAQAYGENLEASVLALQSQVTRSTQFALRASKTIGRIPGMKGVARQIPRTLVKIRRIARKNPLTKILVGGAVNLIPFVAIVNLMVFWIYLSYRDEKNIYRQAREAAEEVIEQTQTA